MFKTIVESVLNEITASLAYEKYYNKIPSDQFFNLVQYYFGKEGDTGDFDRENLKFDKMLTFIFNAILKGDRVYDAKKFIDKYKNAKNEVRIAFLNEFRSGKFEDITDMIYRLEELEKNGVTTLSSFYKNGLIVFYKDEEWTVTCTTTYSANHHYFGHTKWCTASDRLGNYDGWLFFQRYIFDDMDYDPDGLDELGDEDFVIDDESEDYDPEQYAVYPPEKICSALVQFIKNDKSATYQAQITTNGAIEVVCDLDDRKIENDDFISNIISTDVINSLVENGNLLIQKTKEAFPKENEYQEAKRPYLREKRIKLEKKKAQMRAALRPTIEAKQQAKSEFVNNKFEEFSRTDLMSTPSFIESVCKNNKNIHFYVSSNDPEALETGEQILQSQYYFFLFKVQPISDDVYVLTLNQALGKAPDMKSDNNGLPKIANELIRDSRFGGTSARSNNSFIAIVKCGHISGDIKSYTPKIDDIKVDLVLFTKLAEKNWCYYSFRGDDNFGYGSYVPQTTKEILSHYYVFSSQHFGEGDKPDETWIFSGNNYKTIHLNHGLRMITAIGNRLYVIDSPYKGNCSIIDTRTNEVMTCKCLVPTETYQDIEYADAFIVFDTEKLHIVAPKLGFDHYFDLTWKPNKLGHYAVKWIDVYGSIIDIRGPMYTNIFRCNAETFVVESCSWDVFQRLG